MAPPAPCFVDLHESSMVRVRYNHEKKRTGSTDLIRGHLHAKCLPRAWVRRGRYHGACAGRGTSRAAVRMQLRGLWWRVHASWEEYMHHGKLTISIRERDLGDV